MAKTPVIERLMARVIPESFIREGQTEACLVWTGGLTSDAECERQTSQRWRDRQKVLT
jgi:hypothetical protein